MPKYSSVGASALLGQLRAELKARDVRAVELARLLGVAEPTIWRWLRGEGLTLDNLDRICAAIGMDLRDLLSDIRMQEAESFTLAQERVLAADRSLALVFFAILHGSQMDELIATFRLPAERLENHLSRLQRLGLITRPARGNIRALVQKSVRWRKGGPLSIAFNRTVKHLFFSMDFGDAEALYVSDAVYMSAAARERVMAIFESVRKDIHVIDAQERVARIQDRDWSGVLMMVRSLNIDELTTEWSA